MTTIEHFPVQIGEVKTGREGQSLNAILGSCIGIGVMAPLKGVYGLAHALLAESAGGPNDGGGRHVDHAIESLLSQMDVHPDERRKLQVFIAGGANMTMPSDTDPSRLVGTINANFARKALRAAKLRIVHDDTGGETGRRVTLDCTSGAYTITAIPRIGSS